MRLVLRVLLLVVLGWGLAKLIELSPPQWKVFATWFPPVLITVLVAFAFGFSLLRGEALITRIARTYHEGELPDDMIGYTRRLTVVWAFFLLGCAALTMLLVQYAQILASSVADAATDSLSYDRRVFFPQAPFQPVFPSQPPCPSCCSCCCMAAAQIGSNPR